MNTRILLVEDDERLAELTAEYLTRNDFQVAVEPRGDTAETRILAEQPDLVILDVMLPGLSGYDVLDELRRRPETLAQAAQIEGMTPAGLALILAHLRKARRVSSQ